MLWLRLLAALMLIAGSNPAQAYVRTMSSSGRPLGWVTPSVAMQANPVNISGLSAGQVSSMLGDSFAAWQVAGSRVSFSYTQSAANPAVSRNDGVNSVYFSSAGNRTMEWGVVALTEVLYYVSSGQIAEADMVFNDSQFLFTANQGDTGQSIGGHTAIYLRDVATHEAGHVLGLDHSLVNLSSLIYTAFNGQYSLSHDDSNSMRSIYPSGAGGGNLSGSVQGTGGGIFGAHVTAINLITGKVEAGALSASDGSFRLGDIPGGKYAVMMEPFGTDISSVSSYYQNVDHRFCGFSLFRRRFYSSCGSQGELPVLGVSAGSTSSLGTLAPSCTSMGNPGGPPSSIASAKTISNQGGAAFGSMRPGDTHYYAVHGVSGVLSARAISYSLYSPVDVKVQILDSTGNPVAGAASTDNVDAPGPGGVTNYDSVATATVASGDYLIQITSANTRVPASKYSAGYELLDADGHYLVSLAVNGDIAATTAPDMGSCLSVRNRPQSASFQEYSGNNSTKDHAAGCGYLNSGGGGGPFSGGMMQVLVTALAMQLLSVTLRLRRRVALARNRR